MDEQRWRGLVEALKPWDTYVAGDGELSAGVRSPDELLDSLLTHLDRTEPAVADALRYGMTSAGRIDSHTGGEFHTEDEDCDASDPATSPCRHVYPINYPAED